MAFCRFFCLCIVILLPLKSKVVFGNIIMLPHDYTAYIKSLIDAGESQGIVIGYISDTDKEYFSYGKPYKGSQNTVSEKSIYEIGSVTKAFTGLIYAKLVVSGQLSLDQKVSLYLPKEYNNHQYFQNITLESLLTHTSDLPRLPLNMISSDPYNPYVGYKIEDLYAYFDDINEKPKQTGNTNYSNLGFGLLGKLIDWSFPNSYENMIENKIFLPLKMDHTSFGFDSSLSQLQTKGHIGNNIVPHWDFGLFSAAGAITSTAEDLLKFVEENIHKIILPQEISYAQKILIDKSKIRGLSTTLAWNNIENIYFINGETGGYSSFVGFDNVQKKGVVVLSNTKRNIDSLGLHLLVDNFLLEKIREPINISEVDLGQYVGEYAFNENMIANITSENKILQFQISGDLKYELLPFDNNKFFIRGSDILIEFATIDNVQELAFIYKETRSIAIKKLFLN